MSQYQSSTSLCLNHEHHTLRLSHQYHTVCLIHRHHTVCLSHSSTSHCLFVSFTDITLSVSFIDITLSPLSTSQRVSQSSPSQSVSTIWRLYLEHLNNIILSADIDIILYLFELQNSGVYLRVTTYLCPPYSRSSWSSRRTGPNKQNWFVLLETMTVLLECISSTYRRISWRCI